MKLFSAQEGSDGIVTEEPTGTSEKFYFSKKGNTELQQEKVFFKTK